MEASTDKLNDISPQISPSSASSSSSGPSESCWIMLNGSEDHRGNIQPDARTNEELKSDPKMAAPTAPTTEKKSDEQLQGADELDDELDKDFDSLEDIDESDSFHHVSQLESSLHEFRLQPNATQTLKHAINEAYFNPDPYEKHKAELALYRQEIESLRIEVAKISQNLRQVETDKEVRELEDGAKVRSLTEKLAQQAEELRALQEACRQKDAKIAMYERDIFKKQEEELKKMRGSSDQKDQRIAALLEEIKANNDEFAAKLKARDDELQRLKDAIAEKDHKQSSLAEELRLSVKVQIELNGKLRSREDELSRAMRQNMQYSEKLRAFEIEYKKMKDLLAEKEKRIAGLSDEVKLAQKARHDAFVEYNTHMRHKEEDIKKLREQLAQRERELKSNIASASMTEGHRQQQIQALEAQCRSMSTQLLAQTKQLGEATKFYNAMKLAMKEGVRALDRVAAEVSSMMVTIANAHSMAPNARCLAQLNNVIRPHLQSLIQRDDAEAALMLATSPDTHSHMLQSLVQMLVELNSNLLAYQPPSPGSAASAIFQPRALEDISGRIATSGFRIGDVGIFVRDDHSNFEAISQDKDQGGRLFLSPDTLQMCNINPKQTQYLVGEIIEISAEHKAEARNAYRLPSQTPYRLATVVPLPGFVK